MLCKRGKCLLKSWMSAFVLFYKPEEEASSASQDDPQAVSSPCLPFSRPDWKHQPAGLTVLGKRQTVGPAALYSFKYLKYVPGSCQAGRCQAYARVFHDCADRFVYIITFFKILLVYASWHSNSELYLYHYSLEHLTCELLHRFRVWPPPESAGALHKEKGCDKALMV